MVRSTYWPVCILTALAVNLAACGSNHDTTTPRAGPSPLADANEADASDAQGEILDFADAEVTLQTDEFDETGIGTGSRDGEDRAAANRRRRRRPAEIARSRELVLQATTLFHMGVYEKAEDLLQQAIDLHPQNSKACVLLGKIYLMHGSATGDQQLLRSARVLFEIAQALEPASKDPQVLLKLFTEDAQ